MKSQPTTDVGNKNPQVSSFPALDALNFQSLAPRYFVLLVLQGTLLLFFSIAGLVFFIVFNNEQELHLPTFSWVIAPLWLLICGYLYLLFRSSVYAVREHDISYRSGVVFTKLVVQPFTRVQHVELTRGPLERLLGLATLKLFSAGGAMHALALPGLTLQKAEQIRAFVARSKGLEGEQ